MNVSTEAELAEANGLVAYFYRSKTPLPTREERLVAQRRLGELGVKLNHRLIDYDLPTLSA